MTFKTTLRYLLAATLAIWASLSPAQDAPETGIQNTITAQIEAFKLDDFATAFTFASPSIQGMFGTPERFGEMVQRGYPMVWRPADVRYLELREIAGALWQKVQITDSAGNLHFLDYRMSPSENGWKISGVQILKAPDVSA
ncbi:DUF4864 domain-containing protein [Primorskyibacter sp. S187A]|uniref:DUF4864 domain-containing protein n=1 Tax=Primorskyibacter sp. S187A TaxID=3415130 RepID=UPI003C7AE322